MTRKFHYEFELEKGINKNICMGEFRHYEFEQEFTSELAAVIYAIQWMEIWGVNSSNLMYCRVEEVFDSEMRTNVLLWIGE